MQGFRRILVPTDFSPCSKKALPIVRDLVADRSDTKVILVHVIEPPIYPAMFEGAALVVPPYDEHMQERVQKHLEELANSELSGIGNVSTVLRQGPAVGELTSLAEEEKADLIVIATHGHTGFQHMLLGSTAEQVVRAAPCPVLTVRAKD